jgi:hypothetical protein
MWLSATFTSSGNPRFNESFEPEDKRYKTYVQENILMPNREIFTFDLPT